MMRTTLAATASFLVLVACETTTVVPVPTPVEEPAQEVTVPVTSSPVDLAMDTVDSLVDAGNTQTAIDRLTQLLGDASLSDNDKASVIARRAELRASPLGYDLMVAIFDYGQLVDLYPESPAAIDAPSKLEIANGEATSLNFLLAQPETPRGQKFESYFRLGQHEEALDLMLSSGLKPNNKHLIAMYQIGYLCTGEDQTGPAYSAVEPDGTPRELRFCDFGK
jgi:hypothetical protein